MPYPSRLRTRWLCYSLCCALLSLLTPAPQPVVAAPPVLSASPPTLALEVPLGQQRTSAVTITNTSDRQLIPALYEALPNSTLSALASVARQPRRVVLPEQTARIDRRLLATLQAAPTQQSDFLLYLRDQADLSAAYQIRDWSARGQYVYRALVEQAARSQPPLRSMLVARGLRFRPLWIVNALVVHGDLADLQALAARPDVALIRANTITALESPVTSAAAVTDRCNPTNPTNPICWNISQIGADRVWRDFGSNGHGVVVANIDTGVRYDHPALVAQYRGRQANGSFDHNYNWYTPQGLIAAPLDLQGHGTHTMGTMLGIGDGSSAHPSVGVAPGARWIAAQGCNMYGCSESDLIYAAQWMLAPTNMLGEQPRPDLRPMVINNSWAGNGGENWYAGYTAAWRAAGIFPVFAAGNAGGGVQQLCGSVGSPSDYADVVAVGATDQNDAIAGFSLLGPSKTGQIKPDLVAPGAYRGSVQAILSAAAGDGAAYQALQGTSMAAPHVAGLVALLWSANPALIGDYDATLALMRGSAQLLSDTRCGDQLGAPNNVYGYGRIDAYAAVQRARVSVPWLAASVPNQPIDAGMSTIVQVTVDAARVPGPGIYNARVQLFGDDLTQAPATIDIAVNVTPAAQQARLTGRVISAATGLPIAATVGVQAGLGVQTDSTGAYTLTLAAGAYTLVASAPSFLPAELKLTLHGDQQAPTIVMQPNQAHIVLDTSTVISRTVALGQPQHIELPISNTGTQPLYYHVRALPDQFGVTSSDEIGGPRYDWVDLPPDAPTLQLPDNGYNDHVALGIAFPFYSYLLTDTLVTSDGTLAFSLLNTPYNGPKGHCLPASELYFYGIAPFRADLDPAKGGSIRYGTINAGRTFVLSYERVRLHGTDTDQTYTFQVLLHQDGRIVFQYGALGPLPSDLTVGVQRAPDDTQQVGCGPTTPIHSGLAIEFRPQAKASNWLAVGSPEGQVLPGAQQPISATLSWSRSVTRVPQRGRIEITSNDPIHPRVIVPVVLDALPAPHEFYLGQISRRR